MSWFRDGRLHFALGIEDTFVPQAAEGERPIDEYELTEHYRHWHSDLGLAREAGAGLLRWGIPWHRVNPEPGVWEWDWVDRVMARFAELSLEPIVDLLHYGTPLWVNGQFQHPDYPRFVAEYAGRAAERYADVATSYTPVNEPMIHALFSGQYGYWPPYLKGSSGLAAMTKALSRGFVLSQQAVQAALGDRAVFVHVDAGLRYAGDVEQSDAIRLASQQRYLVEDLVTGGVREGHPLLGFLRANGFDDADFAWFQENRALPDVMGVNYYPRHSTEIFERGVQHGGGFADPRPTRDDGIEGLRDVLESYAHRYGAPVMLTETCVTGTVQARIEWLDASVAELVRLRAAGLAVVGYTWWPVFDMYEWTYRHASGPRRDHLLTMGLWDLAERDDDLARVRNPVAARFRSLADQYGTPTTINETA